METFKVVLPYEYKSKILQQWVHANGSTRYSAEDLKELGLPEPHAFTVKKNTLLIANVFGIHRRGDSARKPTRLALWGDSRTNPFTPFIGIGGQYANDLPYYFWIYTEKVSTKKQPIQGNALLGSS